MEDASNQDTAYRRNYLRREILPRLEQLNPRLNQRLWESACQFRREDAYLDGAASAILASLTRLPEGALSLPCGAVTALPEVLALRGIQLLAREADPETVLSAAHRQAVLNLCRSQHPSGQVDLPGGLVARRSYDQLELVRTSEPSGLSPLRRWPCPASPCAEAGSLPAGRRSARRGSSTAPGPSIWPCRNTPAFCCGPPDPAT